MRLIIFIDQALDHPVRTVCAKKFIIFISATTLIANFSANSIATFSTNFSTNFPQQIQSQQSHAIGY
uniref:Uncharacterized protein n=1 Tax=Rhizophagus irregularis (strain DAOM 181602 / DAOM 197198 / MUCL 43194) TaxID=747089 RepID=U9UJZ3_RHIID